MSTQCRIAKQLEDRTFRAATVHYDGYPSHMANVILEHFNSSEKVDLITSVNMESITNSGEVVPEDEANGFEIEPIDIFPDWESLLEERLENKPVLGVAHTYIYSNGKWFGHYPYAVMDPVPLEEYEEFLIKNSGEEDVSW